MKKLTINDKTNLKDSLLTGMKVVLRNGEEYIVMRNCIFIPDLNVDLFVVDLLVGRNHYNGNINLDEYDNQLTNKKEIKYNIMRVYIPSYISSTPFTNKEWKLFWARANQESWDVARKSTGLIRPVVNYTDLRELDDFLPVDNVLLQFSKISRNDLEYLIFSPWEIIEADSV